MLCVAALSFVFSFVAVGLSMADSGPAEMTLVTADAKKPATFPHKKHQDLMGCGECHHTKTDDGKQGPYVAGQEAKCISCHSAKDEFKNNAHKRCKGCHKDGYNGKTGPTKCGDCHKK
ncbi:MAG: cytochrome c family protein [Proteobacteria bacterium]|nr:cytochrome c family protein [Pseudomonadota bacterium]MBU1717059.1 cytochrome c family protein [Pseudomonadota bacterium]